MKIERYQRLATLIAAKSPSRFRLGAVLVKRNRIISVGYNNMAKTHPRMELLSQNPTWSPRLHAEVHCCLGVDPALLVGTTMFVARLLRNGQLAMAKPCGMCLGFLQATGVQKVVYSTYANNFWYALRLVPKELQ